MTDCIRIGIKINEFWDLDFKEIKAYFDAYSANKEQELKEKASANWRLSMMIAAGVGSIFSEKKPPTLFEAYPELFAKEAEEEKWKNYQAQLLQYAQSWNLKR